MSARPTHPQAAEALLGFILKQMGDVYIPREVIDAGFEENEQISIDLVEDGVVVRLVTNE